MAKDSLEILANDHNVKFNDLRKVCEREFGPAKRTTGDHLIFHTGFKDDPILNIQPDKSSDAKPYQVRQVRNLVRRRRANHGQ